MDPQIDTPPQVLDDQYEEPPSDPNKVQTPQEFEDVPLIHPLLKPGGSAGTVKAAINAMKHIPSCVWIQNGTQMNIVVKVSKADPSIVFTGGNVAISTAGGSVGLQGKTYRMPSLQSIISPNQSQPFPFWTWAQTKVLVVVQYNHTTYRFLLEAGNLGVFKDPQVGGMTVWGYDKKVVSAVHPMLLVTST